VVYQIASEQFSGPLDLLLHLIEGEKLDITKISLAKVADEYLRFVQAEAKIDPQDLADFLMVAAKLILIKSKALLPNFELEAEGDLEIQLKLYKEFLAASKVVEGLIKQKKFSYSREKLPVGIEPEFNPPKKLTGEKMAEIFWLALARLEPIVHLPEKTLERVINIEERIRHIKDYIINKIQTTFHEIVGRGDKAEAIVSFLALLELVKQRTLVMDQEELFGDITVKKI
jgi:segregation and condensation protein A